MLSESFWSLLLIVSDEFASVLTVFALISIGSIDDSEFVDDRRSAVTVTELKMNFYIKLKVSFLFFAAVYF